MYVLRRMFEEGMITAQDRKERRRSHPGLPGAGHLPGDGAVRHRAHPARSGRAVRQRAALNDGLKVYPPSTSSASTTPSPPTIKGGSRRQAPGLPRTALNLKKKDWDDFSKKEPGIPRTRGQERRGESAALVTRWKEQRRSRSGTRRVDPPEQAACAQAESRAELEYTKITTLRPSSPRRVCWCAPPIQGVWALEQEPKLQGALIQHDPNSG